MEVSLRMEACRRKHAYGSAIYLKKIITFDFFGFHRMVNRGFIICFIIFCWIIYLSEDGSIQTGACVLEHADTSLPMEWCDQKGEGHEYGSMQTGAISFEKNYNI